MDQTPTDDEKKSMKEPLLLKSSTSKGGFRTLPFIIASEAFEKMASVGLSTNMILYLTKEYGLETAKAANLIFFWSAANNFFPIIGAFLADSYAGRYQMIGVGSILSLLGIFLLWLTAIFPQARPHCDQFSQICETPTILQLLLLYTSFGLMSIGSGGIRSSSLAFGADQLDKRKNPRSVGILQSYFGCYFASLSVSALIAVTCIVYIQDNFGWKIGFGVPLILMFLSALSFYMASSMYIKLHTKNCLFTGFAKVLVASFRNRHIEIPPEDSKEVQYLKKGSMLEVPSQKLRFLNKACVIKNRQEDVTSDGNASNPWSLCTVDQVEELKALLRVMPLWSTGIMLSVTIAQTSFLVIQVATMERQIIPNFEIPPGSFSMFKMISLVVWIAFYDQIALPLASKIKGKPIRLSLKQKMGVGLICSCASIIVVAVVESIRRVTAIREGFSDEPRAIVHMSAFWLLPYYVLGGMAEASCGTGQIEFFYSELPKSMSSIATNLLGLGTSAADLVASLITSSVDAVTRRGGKSWISSNINEGHYDYYYWLITGLCVLNFVYFLGCSKNYGPCQGDDACCKSYASCHEDEENLQAPASKLKCNEKVDDC